MQKVFAMVGDSFQQVGGTCPDGWVEMVGQRPGNHHTAQADGTWLAPTPELPKFYGNDKLDLFSDEEQIAIISMTMTDPYVKRMYDRLLNATFVTYEDPEMEVGLSLLLSKGLLTQERKDEIVAKMHG